MNAVSGCDFLYYLATERNNLKKFKEMAESKYGEAKHVRGTEIPLHHLGEIRDFVVWGRSS